MLIAIYAYKEMCQVFVRSADDDFQFFVEFCFASFFTLYFTPMPHVLQGMMTEAPRQKDELFGNNQLKVMAKQSVRRVIIQKRKGQRRSPTHVLRWAVMTQQLLKEAHKC